MEDLTLNLSTCRFKHASLSQLDQECRDLQEYSHLLEKDLELAGRTIAQKDARIAETQKQLDDERGQVWEDV